MLVGGLAAVVLLAATSRVHADRSRADVVVVGGGPVGLAAAIEARMNGAETVTVLEKRGEERSRVNVLNLNAATVDHLARLGVDLAGTVTFLRERGTQDVAGRRTRTRLPRTSADPRRAGHRVGDLLDGRGPVAQAHIHDLERGLLDASRRLGGIEVRFDTEVTAVEQAGPSVTVVGKGPAGEQRVTGELLVVADGARSPTRDLVGVKVQEVRGLRTRVVGGVFEQPGRGVLVTRDIPGTAVRSTRVVRLGARQTGVLAEVPPDLQLASDAAREQFFRGAAGQVGVGGPIATGPAEFEVTLQKAARVTVGRNIVIIGDAARTTHVFTSLGVNFGLKDAARLGGLYDRLRRARSPAARGRAVQWFSRETQRATARLHGRARAQYDNLRPTRSLTRGADRGRSARPRSRSGSRPGRARAPGSGRARSR